MSAELDEKIIKVICDKLGVTADKVVPETCGVMASCFMVRHGWSTGAGCGNQTSPA